MADFEKAFSKVIDIEGGYVNDPFDAGGETNFGISKRSYPLEDIKGMTAYRAKSIYKRDFWNIMKCDRIIEQEVALNLFDMSVNAGVVPAAKTIQKVVGAKADGVIGDQTIDLLNSASFVIEKFKKARILFYVDITIKTPSKIKYLKGWIIRAFEV